MNNKLKLSLIIIGIIVAIILFTIILFATANNKVILRNKLKKVNLLLEFRKREDLIL